MITMESLNDNDFLEMFKWLLKVYGGKEKIKNNKQLKFYNTHKESVTNYLYNKDKLNPRKATKEEIDWLIDNDYHLGGNYITYDDYKENPYKYRKLNKEEIERVYGGEYRDEIDIVEQALGKKCARIYSGFLTQREFIEACTLSRTGLDGRGPLELYCNFIGSWVSEGLITQALKRTGNYKDVYVVGPDSKFKIIFQTDFKALYEEGEQHDINIVHHDGTIEEVEFVDNRVRDIILGDGLPLRGGLYDRKNSKYRRIIDNDFSLYVHDHKSNMLMSLDVQNIDRIVSTRIPEWGNKEGVVLYPKRDEYEVIIDFNKA